MKKIIRFFSINALIIFLTACELKPALEPTANQTILQPIVNQATVLSPTNSQELFTQTPPTTTTPVPNPSTGVSGVVNPLTGLLVKDPANLSLPPLLVSISNFPSTARPQGGLSYSPMVFELFIGDGMTSNLAVFYGDYPPQDVQLQDQPLNANKLPEPGIGPIHSGRVSFEKIRELFNGWLVMTSSYKSVSARLGNYTTIYGTDESDPNSAMMEVTQLRDIAIDSQKEVSPAALNNLDFTDQPPEGGKPAQSLWMYYSYFNQIFWRYNQMDGNYHRYQDNADGGTFIEATDRLNGYPLTYSNVVVLFVRHLVQRKYVIDLDLLYQKKEPALVFRDGKVYNVFWTTKSEDFEQTTGKLRPIHFVDAPGNPFPLKPGQTWFEIVPLGTAYWETVDSDAYNQLMAGRKPGSGFWAVNFKDPTIGYDN
jgi:hypothetical protein